MNQTPVTTSRPRAADVRVLLRDAVAKLRAILREDSLMKDVPMDASRVIDSAAIAIEAALRQLETSDPAPAPTPARIPGGPTRQQGQFLAFIREFMRRNHAGVAPSHAELQRFFNLTAPSVNSMLVRLEQRGFIRRVPHQARAIELTVKPEWIPPLDRPFKF